MGMVHLLRSRSGECDQVQQRCFGLVLGASKLGSDWPRRFSSKVACFFTNLSSAKQEREKKKKPKHLSCSWVVVCHILHSINFTFIVFTSDILSLDKLNKIKQKWKHFGRAELINPQKRYQSTSSKYSLLFKSKCVTLAIVTATPSWHKNVLNIYFTWPDAAQLQGC